MAARHYATTHDIKRFLSLAISSRRRKCAYVNRGLNKAFKKSVLTNIFFQPYLGGKSLYSSICLCCNFSRASFCNAFSNKVSPITTVTKYNNSRNTSIILKIWFTDLRKFDFLRPERLKMSPNCRLRCSV